MTATAFDYLWRRYLPAGRHGQPCRIVERKRCNQTVLVEFQDGQRLTGPRWAVRRKKEGNSQ